MTPPNLLALSEQALERAGAGWTTREIAQQPALWRRLDAAGADAAREFLAPLLRRPELQIVLTGAGTSAHIGECLAPTLIRRFGARVRAIATTDLVADPEGCLGREPLLLVSFARSGNSPESVAALALAGRVACEIHHLIITCNSNGELCRQGERHDRAHVVRLPDESHDRGFAMTSSFTCMLFAAALSFDLLPPAAAANVARWGEQVLAELPAAGELARAGYQRVVYLGDRELKGLAREAALKLLELTDGQVVAMSETAMGFRHGPKTIIDSRTLVIFLLCNDPYARAYELDLYNELRKDGVAARVTAVTAADTAAALSLRDAASASELELCFPYALFAQGVALQASLALGLRPDAPNARGTVSRVVQGVSVHPWKPGA
jgi:tagatose-6-phosphate ketose/aldose isomerase